MAQTKQGLYFKKDKKAQIYKKVSKGQAPYGYSAGDYFYPIAPAQVWCYSSQLSQTDIFTAAAYSQSETRYFVFNHYKGVEVYDMIQYRGEWYRVTRVDTQDDYNGELFVYVENAKGGWTPGENDDIMPYTPGIWDE